jgi:hypothetical protein
MATQPLRKGRMKKKTEQPTIDASSYATAAAIAGVYYAVIAIAAFIAVARN